MPIESPGLTIVRAEGRTDELGPRRYDLGLSLRRARAVVKTRRSRGIEASRPGARGYGVDGPLGSNTTQGGRDQNRRGEFNILEIDKKPINTPIVRTAVVTR